MTTIRLLLLLCVIYLSSCNNGNSSGSTPEEPYTDFELKIKVSGFADGSLKLLGIYGDQNYFVDSALVDTEGNAVFKKDTVLPGGLYFVLFPDNKFFQILVDQWQHFSLEVDKSDFVNTMKVNNSIDNELFYKNLKFEEEIQKKFNAVKEKLDEAEEGTDEHNKAQKEQDKLVEEREKHIKWFEDKHPESFFTQFKVAGQNPKLKKPKLANGDIDEELQVYYYRKEFWDNVDFTDERMLRTPVYHNKLKRYIKDITPQVADSLIKYADYLTRKSMANKELFKYTANWIALKYQKPKIMGLEAVYVHMIDNFWTYDLAHWSDSSEIKGLRREMSYMKPSLIGNIGQDIRAKNENEEYISLYDLTAPILVIFLFSYECDNCKKETPKLIKVYEEWKDKGVDVFSISIDADRDEWLRYVEKTKMPFHNVFDFERESKYHRKYHVDVTPELYVLNKDRKIIASNIDSEQLPSVFEKEFEKNPY